MKVLTVKSSTILDLEKQTEVHHAFGMEHHTDYVFKPKEDEKYSATIVIVESGPVVDMIISATEGFPDIGFLIDVLDMEKNKIVRYHVKEGVVKEHLRSGWKWIK